jgi:hypothetical protein
MGLTPTCCCASCWHGCAVNHVCVRWFRSLPRPMKTLAAVCKSGRNSLQSGSALAYTTHYGGIGANVSMNCGRRSGIHCPRPLARRSPACKSVGSTPSTLRSGPRGPTRMTRGRCGSLHLRRRGLSRPASCRSPGARVHPVEARSYAATLTSRAVARKTGTGAARNLL